MKKVEEIISEWIQKNKYYFGSVRKAGGEGPIIEPPPEPIKPKEAKKRVSLLGLFILSIISFFIKIEW